MRWPLQCFVEHVLHVFVVGGDGGGCDMGWWWVGEEGERWGAGVGVSERGWEVGIVKEGRRFVGHWW